MLPPTTQRVRNSTAEQINEQIRLQTEQNVAHYAAAGRGAIERRLRELEEEWDIERTLEANAATAILLSISLGATVDRRWLYFPAVISGFLLQHALQGWCPPLPIFRRMGIRTAYEIESERVALKAIRGDFDRLHGNQQMNSQANSAAALQAATA